MYKSTAVLAPAESSGAGGLAKLAGQFGGIASLAGISLGGGGSNKTAEALKIIQSWTFVEEFIREQDIAPEVFAVKGWDPETNELIYKTGVYDFSSKTWTREPPKGKQIEPSSWELYERFSDFLTVIDSGGGGFQYIELEYFSPDIAKSWVDQLVIKINERFKLKDSVEAQENIAFLQGQVSQTPVSSMQTILFSLIEEQTKTLMLTQGSAEYVFRTIEAARVSEERSKPNRVLICFLGAFAGGFFGALFVLFRSFGKGT